MSDKPAWLEDELQKAHARLRRLEPRIAAAREAVGDAGMLKFALRVRELLHTPDLEPLELVGRLKELEYQACEPDRIIDEYERTKRSIASLTRQVYPERFREQAEA